MDQAFAGAGGEPGKLLRFLYLEITQTCNVQCKHCYTGSSPHTRNPEMVDWVRVLHDARELGCNKIQFIGGEPTVHPKLEHFLDVAHGLNFGFVEVYSNLASVSDRLLDQWTAQKVRLATSFYSTKAEVHDSITQSPGSFRRTVRNMERVLERGLRLRVGGTEMPENADERDSVFSFLTKLGVKPELISCDHTRAVGRGSSIVNGPGTTKADPEAALCGNCWRGSLAVSWNGACRPCVFAREANLGYIPQMTLAEVVHSQALEAFRQRHFMRTQLKPYLQS